MRASPQLHQCTTCLRHFKETELPLGHRNLSNVDENLSSNLLSTGKLPVRLGSTELSRWEPDQWRRRSPPGHLIVPLTLVANSCSGQLGEGGNTHHDQRALKIPLICFPSYLLIIFVILLATAFLQPILECQCWEGLTLGPGLFLPWVVFLGCFICHFGFCMVMDT